MPMPPKQTSAASPPTTPSSASLTLEARLTGSTSRAAAEDWIRAHVEPVGAVETAHERPGATVLRVPLANRVVWFKACAPVQAFEPRLTAELGTRWPDR